MSSPLTPARAIAWAAIFDSHPRRLGHWADWSRDLREWADENAPRGETPSQDTENSTQQGTMGSTNTDAPEVRKHLEGYRSTNEELTA
jgi:hypothetical protein